MKKKWKHHHKHYQKEIKNLNDIIGIQKPPYKPSLELKAILSGTNKSRKRIEKNAPLRINGNFQPWIYQPSIVVFGDNSNGQCIPDKIDTQMDTMQDDLIRMNVNKDSVRCVEEPERLDVWRHCPWIERNIISVKAGEKQTLFHVRECKDYEKGRLFRFSMDGIQELNLPQKMRDYSVGKDHLIIISDSGWVYGMGKNQNRQLGVDFDIVFTKEFVPISPFVGGRMKGRSVFCGGNCSFVVTESNELYSFGLNQSQMLGLGPINRPQTPQLVKVDLNESETIDKVSVGSDHTILLTNHQRTFGCGSNGYGCLTTSCKGYFCSLNLPFKVRDVACGNDFSIFLSITLEVYTVGYNAWHGEISTTLRKIEVTSLISRVFAGFNCSYLQDEKDEIWSTGCNEHHQLGLDAKYVGNQVEYCRAKIPWGNTPIRSFAVGGKHCVLLRSLNLDSRFKSSLGKQLTNGTSLGDVFITCLDS